MTTLQMAPNIGNSLQNRLKRLAHPERTHEALTHINLIGLRSLVTCALIALLVSGLVLLLVPTPRASALVNNEDGHVYVLNNDLSGSNSITVFNREEDGSLKLQGTTPIGGLGSLTAFADGTQGSLILTNDEGKRLFAVDAGSDQISVANVRAGHLSLAGVFSSGGVGPISLAYRDGLLYVLNAANGSTSSANVAGFKVDDEGNLRAIPGATQLLSIAHPNPAQIQIDPSGHWLLVTEKLTNLIDVFRIHANGSLSALTSYPSTGVYPFGMAFNPARPNEFIVDDGFGSGGSPPIGAVTAYRLAYGTVSLVNGPVSDFQIAPCWMVITNDGHFAYTSDADSHTISGYSIGEGGAISLLSANGITGSTPSDTFPLEESLSSNSHFLYVLDSRLLLKPPELATLSGFQVNSDGSLTPVVNPANFVLPFSTIGLAAE
jgi:6-phosphogluconolactonase (cycloisomerase 2 family)